MGLDLFVSNKVEVVIGHVVNFDIFDTSQNRKTIAGDCGVRFNTYISRKVCS